MKKTVYVKKMIKDGKTREVFLPKLEFERIMTENGKSLKVKKNGVMVPVTEMIISGVAVRFKVKSKIKEEAEKEPTAEKIS